MLNLVEHILQCVAEEGSELTQAAMKTTRFAVEGSYPDGRSNLNALVQEYNDVLAVIELLAEVLPEAEEFELMGSGLKITEKKLKVVQMMQVAIERNALDPRVQEYIVERSTELKAELKTLNNLRK